MRDYRLYLADIVKSSDKIQRYTGGMTFDDFSNDEIRIDAVARNLEIIGEAVKNIPSAVCERHSEILWNKIGGLRDVLAHGYFKVDVSVLWDIVQTKVPELQSQISQILELEGIKNPLSVTEASLAQLSSTASSRAIYPKQRERAAVIVPIAISLLAAGREPGATPPTQEISPGVEELETEDYQLTIDTNNQIPILSITAKDERGILLVTRLESSTNRLELAGKIIPKDVNKWLQIKQDLDKRSQ